MLALAGLIVVDAGHGPGADRNTVQAVIEQNIELLSEAEHDGWMDYKFNSGWRYGEKRDKAKKLHTALVPYIDLSEDDKCKDRNAVRCYTDIVEKAGFLIRLEEGPIILSRDKVNWRKELIMMEY
ncbi:MAG: hypothetical protein IPM94_14485 [bacterium]|nr:hypothetical protein [bacterium]